LILLKINNILALDRKCIQLHLKLRMKNYLPIFKNIILTLMTLLIFTGCEKEPTTDNTIYEPGTLDGNWKLIRYAEVNYTNYVKTDSISLTSFGGRGNELNITTDSNFTYKYISSGFSYSGKCRVLGNALLLYVGSPSNGQTYFWHRAYKKRLITRNLEGKDPNNAGNYMDVVCEYEK